MFHAALPHPPPCVLVALSGAQESPQLTKAQVRAKHINWRGDWAKECGVSEEGGAIEIRDWRIQNGSPVCFQGLYEGDPHATFF